MTYTGTNLSAYINECLRGVNINDGQMVGANQCDLCLQPKYATHIDCKTIRNTTANLCDRHFATHGAGTNKRMTI